MNLQEYISVNPRICHGQPCFKGTRIMIYLVLELLVAGITPDEIIKRYYPRLNKKAIQAAIHYAAELIKNQEYVPFALGT